MMIIGHGNLQGTDTIMICNIGGTHNSIGCKSLRTLAITFGTSEESQYIIDKNTFLFLVIPLLPVRYE